LRARWKRSAVNKRIARAKIHGGVGSIIGARFADGRVSNPLRLKWLSVRV